MDIEDILALVISIISVLVALSAFLYTWRTNKPRIKGRLNHVLFAPLDAGDVTITSPFTAFMVHMTLTNLGRYPVFIEDYKLEIDRGGGYENINRLTRIRGFPDFSVGHESIKLKNWRDWLIYYPLKAVEFGSPLSGMAVFYSTEPYSEFNANIVKYRCTALDVFGKEHKFETAPNDFIDSGRLVEMFETGGAEVSS